MWHGGDPQAVFLPSGHAGHPHPQSLRTRQHPLTERVLRPNLDFHLGQREFGKIRRLDPRGVFEPPFQEFFELTQSLFLGFGMGGGAEGIRDERSRGRSGVVRPNQDGMT